MESRGLEHNGNIAFLESSANLYGHTAADRPMTDKIVVLSTCANEEEAERLARELVEGRLAACVNVIPGMRSC